MTTKFYVIASDDLALVERVMSRLHSENRLSADDMRDLGHVLEVAIRRTKECELSDTEPLRWK